MSENTLKKQRPSILRPSPDEEKTKDIPPPEKIREMLSKGQMNKAVGESVLNLSSEREKLNDEIAEAKNKLENTHREDHESTKVFNLAQLKANQEVQQLAEKKQKVEKEINSLMHMKNSKMHEDLQKVARYLVQETKRIAPLLENSVKSGQENNSTLEEIKALRGELKTEVSTVLNDVKSVVLGLHQSYRDDYEELDKKKKDLKKEIADLAIKLLPMSEKWKAENEVYNKLLIEMSHLKNEYSLLIAQKHESEKELSHLILEGKDRIVSLQEQKIKIEEEISLLKITWAEMEQKTLSKRELESSLKNLQDDYNSLNDKFIHLEFAQKEESFKLLHHQEEIKKLTIILEDMKQEKEELNNELIILRKIDNELKYATIHSSEKIQETKNGIEEITQKYVEKHQLLEREFNLKEDELKLKNLKLEDDLNHKFTLTEQEWYSKLSSLDNEYNLKKEKKEAELKTLEEIKLEELKERLADTERGIANFLKRNQDDLAKTISDIVYVKGQYGLIKSESAPSLEDLNTEIHKVIGTYFKQTVAPNFKDKWIQKITYYWAISSSLIAVGSLLAFYFKR
jgi:hypothetical protein